MIDRRHTAYAVDTTALPGASLEAAAAAAYGVLTKLYWNQTPAFVTLEGALAAIPDGPAYPSGRTSYTSATARVLREFFGDEVSVSLTNPAVNVTRTYHSLAQMGQEVEDARVWGGMHYRTAVVHGSELGRNVAEYGLKHHLRPVSSLAGH